MLPQAAPRRGGKRRRGNLAAMETVTNRVELALEPSQPFRLDLTALALVRRPSNLIDVWEAGAYRRVVPLGEPGPAAPEAEPVLLEVRSAGKLDGTPFDERLHVSVTGRWSEAELARAGERAATRLLGLDADLSGFYVVAAADERLAPVAERLRGLRPPRYPSVFEALLNAVPCQQVTLVLGLTLLGRLARAYGPEVPFAPLDHATGPLPLPSAASLAAADPADLGALGFSGTKARALIELSQRASSGEVDLSVLPQEANEAVAGTLRSLHGVGRWTSDYVLLRGLGRLDVFPHGDSGARNGLARFLGAEGKPDYEWVARAVAPWQPFAGFVYLHLLVAGMLERAAAG